MKLKLGHGLTLPPDAVTQTFAIFGKRGSGKTNGATVFVEELLKAELPVVILDPVNAWWGLKSSFDGKGPGFPVYVFGTMPQADLPLESTAGALIADLVAKERLPLVLEMKMWGVAERARFVTAFATRLLQVNTEPVMMVLEEADAFIPQRPAKGEEAMLGAMDRLVRWGRQSGVGCTIVTQRSAKVNKDVTTQAETLIAFRTTGPQDREAIDAWIKFHAGEEKRAEVLTTLPTLPNGTGWVWSPEWLDVFKTVSFRRRETFDSAATPKVGQVVRQPRQLAAVDLERLRSQMAATTEKAKADDPRELRKQIQAQNVELAKLRQTANRPECLTTAPKIVEKFVLTDADRAQLAKLADVVTVLSSDHDAILETVRLTVASAVQDAIARADTDRRQARDGFIARLDLKGVQKILDKLAAVQPQPATQTRDAPRREPLTPTNSVGRVRPVSPPGQPAREAAERNGNLTGPEQRIVDAIAWLESIGVEQPEQPAVAFLANYRYGCGGFNNPRGALRQRGLVEYLPGDRIVLTDAGRAVAQYPEEALTNDELQRRVLARLPNPEQRVLVPLLGCYPKAMSNEDLAERANYAVGTGGFNNPKGRLRTLGLVNYPQPGYAVAKPLLFPEDRP